VIDGTLQHDDAPYISTGQLLAGGGGARPRRPHQPDGQRRGDRHHQPGPRRSQGERWGFLHDGLGRFAGRPLALGEEVYASASASNHRHRALANPLEAYGRLGCEPAETVDRYTRQSCLRVSVTELAAMGATLANGGVNPRTGERVVDAAVETHSTTGSGNR
jgi:hypothetical protein